MRLKILIFFLSIFYSGLLFAQNESGRGWLSTADSLFTTKNYKEASIIYSNIIDSGFYSPALLLKTAFSYEHLQEPDLSLYYLNIYYNKIPDLEVFTKMNEMARVNGLTGFELTDSEYFSFLYRKYYYFILLASLLLSGGYFFYIIVKKIKGNPLKARAFLMFFLLFMLAMVSNFNLKADKAIVTGKPALLMSAPSPGSDVIKVLKPGHRVQLLNKIDIWYRIKFNEQTCYLKECDLKIVK